ncbi:MAG: nitroreductase [Dehalococcoidia bacterium]|jgi:nitroreductase
MDVLEAIKSRYSVRAFKSDPVPKKVLKELLSVSLRAPSWANTQTWELAVAGGDVMKDLKETMASRAFAQDERGPDIPRPEWISPYKERRRENGLRLYELLGIRRDDVEKQLNWFVEMYRFFDAPSAIFIFTERDVSVWAMMNIGLLAQTISLAALNYGLGSIMLAAGASYPDIVRKKLNVPYSRQLVIAMAIGYPDNDAAVNKFRTERVPLAEICSWHGV